MKILVTGGRSSLGIYTRASFIMHIAHLPQGKEGDVTNIQVIHKYVENYPMSVGEAFSSVCEGRYIVGGGYDNFSDVTNEVADYNQGWRSLSPLTIKRKYSAASFLQNMLIAACGWVVLIIG